MKLSVDKFFEKVRVCIKNSKTLNFKNLVPTLIEFQSVFFCEDIAVNYFYQVEHKFLKEMQILQNIDEFSNETSKICLP